MNDFDLSDLISEEDLKQFRVDAQENLDDLEEALLQLDGAFDDLELVGRVFRAMHTIKGTASMYGFEAASAFTHKIENFYDRVRNGKATLSKAVIDLTLAARDQLLAMLLESGQPVDEAEVARVTAAFGALVAEPAAPTAPRPALASRARLVNVRFRFRANEPIFRRATNPLVYLQGLRQKGECAVTCHIDRLPPLAELDVGVCHLYWDVGLVTERSEDDLRGEFIFIEDELEELRITAHALADREEDRAAEEGPRLGELLVEQGDLTPDELDQALSAKPLLGEALVASGKVAESKVRAALNQQKLHQEVAARGHKEAAISSVRVASDKLDELVNQVGELVIAQARLRQLIDQRNDNPELLAVAEEISHLTEELRDSTMGIRMLPIGTLFTRFNRLVRDLSRDLRKEIELITEGDDTELDKTVIENLNDPLVHIIRNSIDHGIESPRERERLGKPARGTVRLSAIHSGANVLIRIEDDGQGLNAERILAKARQKGLLEADAQPNEAEVFNLIFAPGFSTAEAITSVSGRGVGMDVVKKAIDALRGEIEVQSTAGQGTVLTIKLPLTLAIIDGFLVQSGGEQFVLPLSTVKECVKLTRQDIDNAHGRQMINIRNEIVPYVRLREIFHLPGERLNKEQVVITEVDRNRVGMVVDHVIGQSQVVIKSLGAVFHNVAEFSGATILGDGRVVPILDVARIVEAARCAARA